MWRRREGVGESWEREREIDRGEINVYKWSTEIKGIE